jgi:hypothetical protein
MSVHKSESCAFPAGLRWRKSSSSGVQNDCVEVAEQLQYIRDSKNPLGGTLKLSFDGASAFRQALGRETLVNA